MTEGESKVNNVHWYQWIWNQLGHLLKKINRFLIWVISLGGVGAGLWFAGVWCVSSIKSCQAEEEARDIWAFQHDKFDVGWLLPLASNEKGTDFYSILKANDSSDKLIIIVQMKKDGGVFRTEDIKRNHVFLVDTLIERPEVKLVSYRHACAIYEKDSPENVLTIVMRNHVTKDDNYNNKDKLYIYINKKDVQRYIILKD